MKYSRIDVDVGALHGATDPTTLGGREKLARPLRVVVDGFGRFEFVAKYRLRTKHWPTEGMFIQLLGLDMIDRKDAVSIAADVLFATTDVLAVTSSSDHAHAYVNQVLISAGFRWCDTSTDGSLVFECARPFVLRNDCKFHITDLARSHINSLFRNVTHPVAYFATGSDVKRGQYGYLFRSSGIRLEISDLATSIPEPQVEGEGQEPERILVEDPLRRIARFAARARTYPILIEDTMLFIEHFNSDFITYPILPGPDTKRWWRALGSNGILDLMRGSRRRRAKFVCQLGVLTAEGRYETFRAEKRGRISHGARVLDDPDLHFPYTSPYNFHNIFVPEGSDVTYAEMLPGQFRAHDYRSECVDQVAPFLRRNGINPTQLSLFP